MSQPVANRLGPLVTVMICAASLAPGCKGDAPQGASPSASVALPATKATASASASAATPATPPELGGATIAIPSGSFEMGSNEPYVGQTPIHKVTLSAYRIDRDEVTAAHYAECVAAGKCASATSINGTWADAAEQALWNPFCNLKRKGGELHPMNCVDHAQATAFCGWAGKRLPTEAEWEYAARGSDGRMYPWGNEAPTVKLVNACDSTCKAEIGKSRGWGKLFAEDDGFVGTAPVGSLPDGKSPAGLHDMSGNVWEWVADGHDMSFYGKSPERDPKGPTAVKNRVTRGGSWNDFDPKFLRATVRPGFGPDNRFANVGFRCAKDDAAAAPL